MQAKVQIFWAVVFLFFFPACESWEKLMGEDKDDNPPAAQPPAPNPQNPDPDPDENPPEEQILVLFGDTLIAGAQFSVSGGGAVSESTQDAADGLAHIAYDRPDGVFGYSGFHISLAGPTDLNAYDGTIRFYLRLSRPLAPTERIFLDVQAPHLDFDWGPWFHLSAVNGFSPLSTAWQGISVPTETFLIHGYGAEITIPFMLFVFQEEQEEPAQPIGFDVDHINWTSH